MDGNSKTMVEKILKIWQNFVAKLKEIIDHLARIVRAFRTFVRMYSQGFYFVENISRNQDGELWGFYRLNDWKHKLSGIGDIDFVFGSTTRTDFYQVRAETRWNQLHNGWMSKREMFELESDDFFSKMKRTPKPIIEEHKDFSKEMSNVDWENIRQTLRKIAERKR